MTIKEIAKLAGVSISTVSKIVNQKDQNINPKTRDRVLQIVKEYNYTPYGTVKNLSTAKSFVIGVLLRDASKSAKVLNGILQTAQKCGYNIMLLDSQNSPELELRHITSLCRNRVDGVIWEPVHFSSYENEHYFNEQEISICYFNGPIPKSSYYIDYEQLGYVLTQKLLDYKHTKIACLMRPDSLRAEMVFEGFKKCLFDNQITFDKKMLLFHNDNSSWHKIMTGRITGIITPHYTTALELYEQMHTLHYHIPADLSVVSLKEERQSSISFPYISSIQIPHSEFGSYLCENLIAKCEKAPDHQENLLFSVEPVFDTERSIEIPSFYRSKKIVVVGSINTDYTFNVNQIPQAGKTTRINNLTTSLGGKGANQAVGAARLGRDVALIGEIGQDTDSDFIIDILEKQRVDTNGIHRDIKLPTGKAYIYVEKSGESTITVFSGANHNLTPESIRLRQHLFENAGYCLLSTEVNHGTILEASSIAEKYGVKTILKPSTLENVSADLASHIDIIVPNRKEAVLLCPGCDTVEQQANYLFSLGIDTVIITLGHEGCYLKTADQEQYFPASDFISVDTTGGADAFISALAAYLTEGYSIEKAIRIATYAAGFCISRQGVVPALVDQSTLNAHIRRIEPDLLYAEAE